MEPALQNTNVVKKLITQQTNPKPSYVMAISLFMVALFVYLYFNITASAVASNYVDQNGDIAQVKKYGHTLSVLIGNKKYTLIKSGLSLTLMDISKIPVKEGIFNKQNHLIKWLDGDTGRKHMYVEL
jgi:hypothetical protein